MNQAIPSLNSEYWQNRYLTNKTGWDVGQPTTPLKMYFDQLESKNIAILIPGCGNAYEAEYLFRQRASNLEQQLRQKDAEIAKLKEDNQVLFIENTSLKTSQSKLSDSLTTARRTNIDLSEKVAIASRLEAQNIKVSVINQRGKEKEDSDEEFKAKRIEKIKVNFNLAKNEVAPKEPKEIMMRLIEPDGAALYNLSTGSGTFEYDGNETFYTAKKEIVFDNSQQPVSFIYSKGSEYKRGKHTIELYSGGYLIGKTSFTLK